MEKTILSKNAAVILIKLLEGATKMSYLQEVVRNYSTLQLTIRDLEEMGYVKTEEKKERGRVVYVSLTPRGRAVAEKLQEAVMISRMTTSEIQRMGRLARRYNNMKAYAHFNAIDNLIRVSEYDPDGTVRYADVEIKCVSNKMYLYCNLCDSCCCEHIKYIFSHYKLRGDLERKANAESRVLLSCEEAEKLRKITTGEQEEKL